MDEKASFFSLHQRVTPRLTRHKGEKKSYEERIPILSLASVPPRLRPRPLQRSSFGCSTAGAIYTGEIRFCLLLGSFSPEHMQPRRPCPSSNAPKYAAKRTGRKSLLPPLPPKASLIDWFHFWLFMALLLPLRDKVAENEKIFSLKFK